MISCLHLLDTPKYIHPHLHAETIAYAPKHIHVEVQTYMQVFLQTCTLTGIQVCLHIHTCTCAYTLDIPTYFPYLLVLDTHIHTHIHTKTNACHIWILYNLYMLYKHTFNLSINTVYPKPTAHISMDAHYMYKFRYRHTTHKHILNIHVYKPQWNAHTNAYTPHTHTKHKHQNRHTRDILMPAI